MKVVPLDLTHCSSGISGRPFYPDHAKLKAQYLLLKIFDPSLFNPIGFLGRIHPADLDALLPHENILSEVVNAKFRSLLYEKAMNKPVFVIYEEEHGIIEHLRKGFRYGTTIGKVKQTGISTELRITDDENWNLELESIIGKFPRMMIGDGHHRTSAYRSILEEDYHSRGLYSAFFSDRQISIFSFARFLRIPVGLQPLFWDKIKKYCEVSVVPLESANLCDGTFLCVHVNKIYRLDWKNRMMPFGLSAETLDVYLFHALILPVEREKRSEVLQEVDIDFVPKTEIKDVLRNSYGKEIFVFLFPAVKGNILIRETLNGKIMPAKSTWIEPKMTSKLINVPL